MTGLDRLSYQSRWFHVSPVRKFLLWLMMMILAFTLPPLGQGIELLPFGFLTIGVVTILFSFSRDPQTLLASIPVGSYWLGVSASGLFTANETFWRSLAALAATLWLVLNLPFPQLIILLKRAHVPRLLTEQILLTWRFIFILLDEALAIHRAQTLRFGYRSLPLGYRSLAMLVGLLFTRVLIRYQQMTTTLDIKLYQGDFHL